MDGWIEKQQQNCEEGFWNEIKYQEAELTKYVNEIGWRWLTMSNEGTEPVLSEAHIIYSCV